MTPIIDPASCLGALRLARDLIESEYDRFICLALCDVMCSHPGLADACDLLRDYVQERCKWSDYWSPDLETWLTQQLLRRGVPAHIHRLARLAWIDRMIYQLEKDGTLP